MSQGNWDDIDGACWIEAIREKQPNFLIQESIGDPVLPNPGSETVAITSDALQVGAVLEAIEGLDAAGAATARSGITQYRVPDTEASHCFAARDTPAGAAAREQIRRCASVFAGAPGSRSPRAARRSCDFTGQ
jgi:hypothetical protein